MENVVCVALLLCLVHSGNGQTTKATTTTTTTTTTTVAPKPLAPTSWTITQLVPATNYNLLAKPMQPLPVDVKIKVISLLTVTESDQTFSVDMEYTQQWADDRLVFPPANMLPMIILDTSIKAKMYTPDLFFTNGITVTTLSSPNPISYITLRPNSTVALLSRLTAKFSCNMNLFRFPMDNQYCSINIGSLSNNISQIDLSINPFEIANQDQYPKFYVKFPKTSNCSTDGKVCSRATIALFRKLGYYVIRIYAPTFLLTVTSFVGFWIPVLGWPARVAVVVTPFMAIIVTQVSVYTDLNISYIVALRKQNNLVLFRLTFFYTDIWMAFCEFFVFMSLIEYATAIAWAHAVEDSKENKTSSDLKFMHYLSMLVYKVFGPINFEKAPTNRNKIDYLARIVYPCTWILFVFLYLCVFCWPWLADNA